MTKCTGCNGDVNDTACCDFCDEYKCEDCINTYDFIETCWTCCESCNDLITEYADQEDIELIYDNTETFMLHMNSLKKDEA